MAVGPYSTDAANILPGQITATPARVLRRRAIRVTRLTGARGVRGRRRR